MNIERHNPFFVLLGAPGAGKSTQGARLAQILDGEFFSAGTLLRTEANSQSMLGRQIEPIISAGGTVPEDLLLPVLEKAVASISPSISYGHVAMFDFGGTSDQCVTLGEMLAKHNYAIFASLLLNVSLVESRARLTARGRNDDNIDMIDKRLVLYEQEIIPVRKYYEEHGLLRIVDGVGTPEEVTKSLLKQIQNL